MLNRLKNLYRRNFWSPVRYARHIGVSIGKNCLISTINFPSEAYLIEIGDYCRIAGGVSFFTHGGLWSQRWKHNDLEYFGKIRIGNYTYIGEGAKIMAGVELGDDVIIGAGSIVTKSVPNGKVAAGNPARIVGDTVDFVSKIRNQSLPTYKMNAEEKRKYLISLSEDKFIKK